MSPHLLPVTGQGHVHKVRLIAQLLEGGLDALLEVVPFQAELFALRPRHGRGSSTGTGRHLPATLHTTPFENNRSQVLAVN